MLKVYGNRTFALVELGLIDMLTKPGLNGDATGGGGYLGLVLDGSGFVRCSQVFEDNVEEARTLEPC